MYLQFTKLGQKSSDVKSEICRKNWVEMPKEKIPENSITCNDFHFFHFSRLTSPM